jgi:hypothetical protein
MSYPTAVERMQMVKKHEDEDDESPLDKVIHKVLGEVSCVCRKQFFCFRSLLPQ